MTSLRSFMVEYVMVLARILAVVVLLAFAVPAQAADVTYPTGSRIGMALPSGDFKSSRNFSGFEDVGRQVAIVIAALPAEAYDEFARSTTPALLMKQGVTLESREDFPHPLGKAFLTIGRHQGADSNLRKWILAIATRELTVLVTVQLPDAAGATYPDDAIGAALRTVAIRPTIPVDEQLSLLPFGVRELAGFRVGGIMPGRAIMLTDGKPEDDKKSVDVHIVAALAPGRPASPAERDNFARDVFANIPNLKDVRITSAEPLRLGGYQAHQIMASGKDPGTGTEITLVQWLLFGGGAYLHLVGVAPTPAWVAAYGRFRQVRDGIVLR
jgi:hypothetical protein